jgi:hypothetical protein
MDFLSNHDLGKRRPRNWYEAELQRQHVGYWVKETGGSLNFKDNLGRKAAYKVPADKSFLGLFSKVKRDAKKHRENHPDFYFPPLGPQCVTYSSIKDDRLRVAGTIDGAKLDVSAAYWNYAKDLFLSQDTYDYGYRHKEARLKALGALATSYTEEWIDTNGYQVALEKYRSEYANLFFYIARELGEEMLMFMQVQKPVFFMWVDCFFADTQDDRELDYLSRRFEAQTGFQLKIEKCLFEFVDAPETPYISSLNSEGKDKKYPIL